MEKTLSAEEAARLPTPEEEEYLAAQLLGAMSVFMGAPVLADVDRIVTIVNWADGTLTIAAQPDVPRNVTVALTDADNSVTGLLTITGEDAQGRTITETMQPLGDGNGKTLTGTKPFAKITSCVITGTAGAAAGVDQLTIGVGKVIGLPVDLIATAGVLHVFLGATRIAAPVITAGVSTSGIDVSAGTYDGAKWMWALIRPTKRA
jgi:hypothetical protein